MIIAHVLSSYAVGGQERMALELVRGQRRFGHELVSVSLATAPDGPLAQEFSASGARVYSIAKRSGVDPALPFRLARMFLREGVELVHTHNPQALIYGAPAARMAGAAVVHTKHGANPASVRRRWLRRAAGALTDAYVAVSPTTAAVARQLRDCAPKKLSVIENGVDVRRFVPDEVARHAIREELGIPEAARVVGSVGRIAAEKNYPLLIRAMEPLLDETTRLVIVGDGAELSELRTRCARLPGGAFVHLTGARDDVPALLAAFDVFALSSRTEGLPLVVPEAMAVGLPVVATSVGGIPDVIAHEQSGCLVASGDEQALRYWLERLCRDRSKAAEMGWTARATALGRYSSESMVARYLSLYEKVLQHRAASELVRPQAAFI